MALLKVVQLAAVASVLAQSKVDQLLNVSAGTLIKGLGGIGGSTTCSRWKNLGCSTKPRQLIGAVDFALDESGRHLYVATTGLDYIEGCQDPECFNNTHTHDNSSRLLHFDLQTQGEPVTMSYCGPWKQVKYDSKRRQVVALRHTSMSGKNSAEVVAFDAHGAPATDANSKSCAVYPGIGITATCACAKGLDVANLNGKVIGRAGLQKDGILPAATMTLLGDDVLVGDQNNYCIVAFPLEGSAGTDTKGTPVAGTCGKSCGSQGCASIGSPPVKAGKRLGDGSHGMDLTYGLFSTPDGRLLLHDMNTETIDYGRSPKAETEYMTVPIDPGTSSLYVNPTFHPDSGELLVLEKFSRAGVLLEGTVKSGYKNPQKLVDAGELSGTYVEASAYFKPHPISVAGLAFAWVFTSAKKLLVLVSYALPTGSEYLDHAFVELDVQ